MTKFSLSYLAGALSVGIAIYLDGGRGSLVAFGLGVLTVVAIAVALLASTSKLRRAARFMTAFADGIEARQQIEKGTVDMQITPNPDGGMNMQITPSSIEGQVASALVNFKMPKKIAIAAARRAVQQEPHDFNKAFSVAVQLAKVAA
jgi:hypothetical protein